MHAYIVYGTVRSPRQYWVCAGGANDARSASFLGGCFWGKFWRYLDLFRPIVLQLALLVLFGTLLALPGPKGSKRAEMVQPQGGTSPSGTTATPGASHSVASPLPVSPCWHPHNRQGTPRGDTHGAIPKAQSAAGTPPTAAPTEKRIYIFMLRSITACATCARMSVLGVTVVGPLHRVKPSTSRVTFCSRVTW